MKKSIAKKTNDQLLKDFENKLNLGYNLVDYFLTIGVEPEVFLSPWLYESPIEELNTTYKEELQPKILNKFPTFDKQCIGIDETIIHHCFPLGFKVQEFTIEKPEFKVFYIILDNNNYSEVHQFKYVVCLLFYESINDYMKLYEKYFNINGTNINQNKNNNFRKSVNNSNANNSFYLEQKGLFNFNDNISNYSSHTYNNNNIRTKKINNFSILSYNGMSEYSQKETNICSFINNKYYKKYYIPKCICLLSLYPFITELTKIIKIIYKYSLLENIEIPLEKIINNLILEVPIPPRGLYSIEYPILEETILLRNSKLNELFYVSFEFNLLFTKFNIEQVLKIFQYLMLGTKLVFFSSEIEFLTPIILASLILIFPFKFPFTVVSILPKESYYLIDNITPEIFGINEKYNYSFFQDNDIEINGHLLIIDIDNNNIIPFKSKNIEELPPLPKHLKEKLSEKLKNYISTIHKNMKKDIREPIKNFQFKIRRIFLEFQIELLKDYPKFLNNNIYEHPLEKPFKVKKFLNRVPSEDHLFYEKFTETQLFNDYILKKMTPKDKSEQTEVLYFEEKIFILKEQYDKIIFLNSNLFNFKNEYKVPKVNPLMDEEIINYYLNDKNLKKFLLEGTSLEILKINNLNLRERTKTSSFNSDATFNMNIKNIFNENKLMFNYIIFPKLNNDLFFKSEIKNYYLDLSIFNEIKNINSELISKSHLSRVELKTNEMSNYIFILWLKVWANSFYYHDKKEQKYRYLQMLRVFDNINQHEMNVISNMFQGLIKANVDEDLIFYLYNKILQLKLSPSFDIYNAIKNKIRKKKNYTAMPSSEINKYLLDRGQIHISKYDINKKSFRKRTMKGIYDLHMIKEKVSFIMEETCNNCDKKIDLYHFQKNINNTNNDIVWAKCPFCQFDYLPKLKVVFGDEINKNDKLSKCTSIVDEVILYSPKTLKMNFFDNSNIDVDNLKLNYHPIFWNLIYYFKIAGLPFDFILPYEENIFFKQKKKAHNFFKVNISNKSNGVDYLIKSEKMYERTERKFPNYSRLEKIEPKMKLNNSIVNNSLTDTSEANLVTLFSKNENKSFRITCYKKNLVNIDNNINMDNLKLSNKQLNNTENKFYNNSLSNIPSTPNKKFYNLSLTNNDKKINNIKSFFINNNNNNIAASHSKNLSFVPAVKNSSNNINQKINNNLDNNKKNINNNNNNIINNKITNNIVDNNKIIISNSFNNNIINNINNNITNANISNTNNKINKDTIKNLINNYKIPQINNQFNNPSIINNKNTNNNDNNTLNINKNGNYIFNNNPLISNKNLNNTYINNNIMIVNRKINTPMINYRNMNNSQILYHNNIIFNNTMINYNKQNNNNNNYFNLINYKSSNITPIRRNNLRKNSVIPPLSIINNNIYNSNNQYLINNNKNNMLNNNLNINNFYTNNHIYLLNNNITHSQRYTVTTPYIYK